MPILKKACLDKPGTTNVLSYAYGNVALTADAGGGFADVALPGFSDDAQVFVNYGGGLFITANAGILLVGYDSVTGILSILSSNIADANTVHYLLVD